MKITPEEYKEIINLSPEDRVRKCDNTLEDKIVGILIAFSKIYDMRDGWIDIITTKDAKREIKELIVECGGEIE